MINIIKKTFAIDDVAAKNLVVACIASLFATLAILSTNVVLFIFVADILMPILNNQAIEINILKYVIYIIGISLLLVLSITIKYKKAYIPAYMTSAEKRMKLAERLRKLPLSFFGKKDISDITTTIMKDTSSLEDVFSAFLPTLFSAVVSTIIMCVGMMFYNLKLGIAIFWCVPISFILIFLTKKIQTNEGGKQKAITLNYIDKLQECVENMKDIKANNREEFHKKEMFSQFKKLENALFVAEMKIGTMVTSIQMILKIGMATTIIVSSNMLISGSISVMEFIVFLMIATRVYDPLQSALIHISALFQASLSINRMKEFEAVKIQEGKSEVNYHGYDIKFENVTFAYDDKKDNENNMVLDGISFSAKQGEITALVGPSGGGKSTTLKLAARFWDCNSGKITVGGEDIKLIDPEKLLEEVSIVFQDVTLFNNTVLENIRIGRKDATDEEVIEAAKNAKCHDFIEAMTDGYNTMIGENGSKLSGGERQRLSIARALLKDAPIVLLDEATSSLDIKNETAVQQAIVNLTKNKTVVVIAHRMRTIMGADNIIVIKDGKVSQKGTHKDLIKVDGEYKTMVNLQVASANWSLA